VKLVAENHENEYPISKGTPISDVRGIRDQGCRDQGDVRYTSAYRNAGEA
jgi:hypothetical protein